MDRFLKIVLLVGILVWAFLMLERAEPEVPRSADVVAGIDGRIENIEDAEASHRCAEFRQEVTEDGAVWTLGYGGRIRQLFKGCF
jgi:hypothetical protein